MLQIIFPKGFTSRKKKMPVGNPCPKIKTLKQVRSMAQLYPSYIFSSMTLYINILFSVFLLRNVRPFYYVAYNLSFFPVL